MTEAEWKVLEAYVADMQRILRVQDWVVKVKRDDPPDSNNEAATYILNDADEAHISLNAHFREWEADRQRSVVVHEVLHLHFDRLHDYAEQSLKGAAPAAWAGMEENQRRTWERAVEKLAQAVAPLLPPIKWPEEAK